MSGVIIPAGVTSFGFPTQQTTTPQPSPSPWTSPQAWNAVLFGNGAFTWNGKVKFKGAKRSYEWHVKKGAGAQGEVVTFRGLVTKPFTLEIEAWDEAQWAKLPTLVDFLGYAAKPNPNGFASPIDIYHPALFIVGISQVYILDIGAPEVDQERTGMVSLAIVMREFALPPAVDVTTTPAASNVPLVVLNRAGGSTGAVIQTQQQNIQNEAVNLPTTLP